MTNRKPHSLPVKPGCDQIIDILPDPFVIVDRDYTILAANKAYQERYDIKASGIVGRRCHEVSHHSDVPCSQHGESCPLEQVFATGKAATVMHVHYNQNNQEEYVQLQAAPILSDDGEIMYMGECIQQVSRADQHDELLIGRSPAFLRLISILQRVAPTQSTVLLLGESGVGKEKVAEYLHHYSTRSSSPFVVVDCSTLGENLIESELFGHEKGAFTGATSRKPGLFESARGGTLLIDEICELPLALQTKLLRALESGNIRRIGGNEYIKADVRVIAATNRDIQAMVRAGQFRQDLYYRLSAFPVHVPTLRDRKDDIVALAEYFLRIIPDGERHIPLSSECIEKLLGYSFPGNVRELRNIIERAVILAYEDTISPDHIVLEDSLKENDNLVSDHVVDYVARRNGRLTDDLVINALERAKGHRNRAADILGVSERTLYRYIKRMRSD